MFLANMSHEIRTPMNAVIGVAHLLETTPLSDDQRQLLGKLQIAGRSLLGIINDVLDLSKIEAGEIRIDAAPMDPAGLLRELEQMFGPQAQAKGIALTLEGLEALPPRIVIDELRLRQALVNLVSNAIKFTEHGGVRVFVQREADTHGAPWLRWSVQDTGVGISPAARVRLFDPFVQADASTTRRFGGTGLGLSIVRRLAGLMGGEVGLQSEPGRGSLFWLRLPLVEATEPAPAQPAAIEGGLQILVVDDSADDRRTLGALCRSLGWQVRELDSGSALATHCRRIVDEGLAPPDALLVDWDMPGMDGLQALALVADGLGRQRLPAALLVEADRREAADALAHRHPVDHILTKPIGASELFNAVNHSVSRHAGSTARVARSTRIDAIDAQWLQGVRVLIVDDSDINLEVARRLLEREGAIVQTCVNGLDALGWLGREPDGFDVVLMDVQMPEMDGYEATRRIRSALGLKNLPVLALTAGALDEERRRAEAAGMNAFLTKPLDPQALVRALRQAVEVARGQPLELSTRTASTTSLPADWPAIEGIDGGQAARQVGEDQDLFLRLLARLLREFTPAQFAQTPGGHDAAARTLALRVHKLRGSAGLLGALAVHRIASEVERTLAKEQSADAAAAGLQALDQALAALAQAARPVLETRLPVQDHSGFAGLETTPASDLSVATLCTLLRQQDFAAAEQFKDLGPALAARWGYAHFESVRQAIEDLDFATALALIDRIPAHRQPTPSG